MGLRHLYFLEGHQLILMHSEGQIPQIWPNHLILQVRSWGPKLLSDIPKVTQIISHIAGVRVHVFRFFLLYYLIFFHNSISPYEIRPQNFIPKRDHNLYPIPWELPKTSSIIVSLLPLCPAVCCCYDKCIILWGGKHPPPVIFTRIQQTNSQSILMVFLYCFHQPLSSDTSL